MGADYLQHRTHSSAISHLNVVFLLFLYFGLTVDGRGERDVGTIEVMSIFALVRPVLALALVVVADAEEYDADDDEYRNSKGTCHGTVYK